MQLSSREICNKSFLFYKLETMEILFIPSSSFYNLLNSYNPSIFVMILCSILSSSIKIHFSRPPIFSILL